VVVLQVVVLQMMTMIDDLLSHHFQVRPSVRRQERTFAVIQQETRNKTKQNKRQDALMWRHAFASRAGSLAL
jgi:hypothetical protein